MTTKYFVTAKTQPTFFWSLMVFASVTLYLCIPMVLRPSLLDIPAWEIPRSVIPMQGWGLIGIIGVLIKLYGLMYMKSLYARIGTGILGFFYFAIGISLAFNVLLIPAQSYTGPGIWIGVAILHFIMLFEPYKGRQ